MIFFKKLQYLYSKFNFFVNLILTILMVVLGWLFTSVFYPTKLAIWLTDNAGNTFVGDFLNPFPTIVEMLAKAFVPLFLAMGIAFFLFSYVKETGVNKIGWLLSLLAKGSIKTIQAFTSVLVGGCSYVVYNWDKVHTHHTILEANDINGFKVVLALLASFWVVCWLMKFAAKINFKELGDDPNKVEKWLKEFSDKYAKAIAYSCLGLSLCVSLFLPFYDFYDKIKLVQEACAEETKQQCDLPDFQDLL